MEQKSLPMRRHSSPQRFASLSLINLIATIDLRIAGHLEIGAYVVRSELELECQLDGARAADLVEGVKATVCAAGAQAVRQRLC